MANLENMTAEELAQLIVEAQNQKFLVENAERDEAEARKIRIKEAGVKLAALLGPENPVAGQTSIREVLAYGKVLIEANPGPAVFLILNGLEELVENLLDISKVISET